MNEIYKKELKSYPPLDKEQTEFLFQKFKSENNIEAFNKLVKSNLRLVVFFANQYHKAYPSVEIDDLIAEGNIGLIEAIKKFELSHNVKFSYYASFWIKKYIIQFIQIDKPIQIKDDFQIEILEQEENDFELDEFKKFQTQQIFKNLTEKEVQIIKMYFGFDGEELTCEEIADELGLTRQRISQIKNKALEKITQLKNQLKNENQ